MATFMHHIRCRCRLETGCLMPWDILLANLIKLDTVSLLFKRREDMVNRQHTEGCEFMSLKMKIRIKPGPARHYRICLQILSSIFTHPEFLETKRQAVSNARREGSPECMHIHWECGHSSGIVSRSLMLSIATWRCWIWYPKKDHSNRTDFVSSLPSSKGFSISRTFYGPFVCNIPLNSSPLGRMYPLLPFLSPPKCMTHWRNHANCLQSHMPFVSRSGGEVEAPRWRCRSGYYGPYSLESPVTSRSGSPDDA